MEFAESASALKNVIAKYFAATATKKEKVSCPNVQITL